MARVFTCNTCGSAHEFPTFGWDYPMPVLFVPAGERAARVQLAPDECIIDESEFFVRGCVKIPVHEQEQPFIWGVWARVSEDDFFDLREGDATRTFRGVLPSVPPIYDDSEPEVEIRCQPGLRPSFLVADKHHAMAVHQQSGLTAGEVVTIAEQVLHGKR